MTEQILPYKNLSLQNLDGEKWEDVEDLEGLYQVSNFGRVKSLERKAWNQSRQIYKRVPERILRQNFKPKLAHCDVRLQSKELGINRTYQASVLVARAFIPNNSGSRYVFHLDADVSNNNVANLIWRDSNYFSDMRLNVKKKATGKLKGKFIYTPSKYKGVIEQKYFICQVISKKHNLKIRETFRDEIDAARQYDFYVDKFKLQRDKNFPSNALRESATKE